MNNKWWSGIATAVGAGGVLVAVMASTPAFGSNNSPAIAAAPKIFSAGRVATFTLNNSNKTIVSLKVPAGKWLISGKLWADSQPGKSTTNTVVGCSIFAGSKFLDASAFNSPKVNGAGGSSAGVEALSAAIATKAKTTVITLHCDDFGSMAQAHNTVLTAIGG